MTTLRKLHTLREAGPARRTTGLPDDVVARFAARDGDLAGAVDDAVERFECLREEFPEIVAMDEPEQVRTIQEGFVNFYAATSVNPYVALAARGPWIVTLKGAVLHDSGGYGMLGLGHAPAAVLAAMARPQAMANVMTANTSQLRLVRALRREIGHRRPDGCPFARFACLNSGSEAVTLAARFSDVNAKLRTDPGGTHAGRPIRTLALSHGFHGRTDRPAQFSDSSLRSYRKHLASFRDLDNLVTVAPNDVAGLREAFARADRDGIFLEAMLVEPVMGEGNPGLAVEPEFYAAARELTRTHGALLIVDSIQAGLRAQGCLSIVDYPGFETLDPPDLETYSKAINAGQYPLSVLAVAPSAVELYRTGIYGNTMTSNPRAMDVAVAVLSAMTPELRANIRERGREMVARLESLAREMDGVITSVQGTGLLLSCGLADGYLAHGAGSVEESMRVHGIGVIHGGENSLRFTPHFAITTEEIDLIVDAVRAALVRAGGRTAVPDPSR